MFDRTLETLLALLPAGFLGISVALASAPAKAMPSQPKIVSKAASGESVATRLQAIRNGVSTITGDGAATEPGSNPNLLKVWWGNGGWGRWHGGWGNGGWGRGGWGNGGWHNGWHNGGWGNGGWGNGGWHNGPWGNFWRNW